MPDSTEEELQNMSPEEAAELQQKNCIFCKISSGEIPSKKVYEDSDFIGILDINPSTEGHVLLITKQHFQIMPQIPQDIVGKLGIASKKLANKILKAFASEGATIFIANGFVAGQKAPHFIVHLIPRKENDDVGLIPEINDIPKEEYDSIKGKLTAALGNTPKPKEESEKPKKESKKSKEKPAMKDDKADLDKISGLFT